MADTWLPFAAPLAVFGVVTFLATWWLRGHGFRDLLGGDRKGPPRG